MSWHTLVTGGFLWRERYYYHDKRLANTLYIAQLSPWFTMQHETLASREFLDNQKVR